LRSIRDCDRIAVGTNHPNRGNSMGPTDRKSERSKDSDGKSKKPPSAPADDDYEDGDIATPKRDPVGDDDQPL
jgi:hypothetical protein